MIKIEKNGHLTLEPDSEEVIECLESLDQVLKNYDPSDALYALVFKMVALAFGPELRMEPETLEDFLNLMADHLSQSIEKMGSENAA